MSKYYLTVAYYNAITKKYEKEEIVTLPQVDLSSIQKIDSFTSKQSKTSILERIEEELGHKGWNHLAIKYYHTKDSNPIYYKIIENNKEFNSCTENLRQITYQLPNRFITAPCINKENPYYLKEVKKILEIINHQKIEDFEKKYPYKDDFWFVVTRYLNSFYDEPMAQQKDIELILTEFSRYITFRKWIIEQEKQKDQYRTNWISGRVTPLQVSKNLKTPNISTPAKSINDYEEQFRKEYEQKHNMSYEQGQIYLHNTAYLHEDKEEFLEESEIEMMTGEEQFQYKETRVHKKRLP